jgi:hypothetical protein
MSGRNQRRFEKEFLGDRLERRSHNFYRSTLRIAAHRTAPAASDFCTEPFLHGSSRNPNSVGLRGIGLERSFIYHSGLEDRLNTQGAECLLESIEGPLDCLMRGIAAIARLPV